MSDYLFASRYSINERGERLRFEQDNMASTLGALTSITSFLAQAYFTIGHTYHSLPDPVAGLRNAFTVSEYRELPDLIMLFGMLQAKILGAHAAMLSGDEYTMVKDMWVSNELIFEAWWKVSWLDRVMVNWAGDGEDVEWVEDADDDEKEYEKWKDALPDCCGMFESF